MNKKDHAITHIGYGDGEMIPLDEAPCHHCGKIGVQHIAISKDVAFGLCSMECFHAGIRINGEPVTEETMKAAGLHLISPKAAA